MTCQKNYSGSQNAVELILENGVENLGEAVGMLINQAMEVERRKYLKAEPYERSPDRTGYANGFKEKHWKSRLGKLALKIPQTRDGAFYPSVLEKGQRSERALALAIAEMYVQGVSTRKVTAVMEELCGFSVSSTDVSRCAKLLDEELEQWRSRKLGRYIYLYLDARYEKIRQQGRVVDCAVLIAVGVDEKGKREVIGVSVALSEAEVHWRKFLESLVSRGLHGIKGIISDAHAGLKAARTAVFPSVPWQRCQFHLQQNAQKYVTRVSEKSKVAASIRSIFNAPNREEGERLMRMAIKEYEPSMPPLTNWMEENLAEGLTVFSFPPAHWKQTRTTNLVERLNREIKRRTRIVSIFANEASCERLVSAVLVEISEEWQTGKIYLTMNEKNEG